MINPIPTINWQAKDEIVDALIEQDASLTITPMDAGLEAEVVKITLADASYVLKIWSKSSKPNVRSQYLLLDALYNQGLAVSKPHGWGKEENDHLVLLTSFDGIPIHKLDKIKLSSFVDILTDIHKFPIDVLEPDPLPRYDFVGYFFHRVDEHPDVKELLIQLVEKANPRQDCLIHGDFHTANLVEADGRYSVIDWTNGQLGDPKYDIAWSVFLMKIYVSERKAAVYLKAFLAKGLYTPEELELFEAIAFLRWLLLHRRFNLAKGKKAITRLKGILTSNPHLPDSLI